MKKRTIIFIVIIVIVVAIAIGLMYFLFAGMKYIKALSVNDVDLSQAKDGTYTGEFKGYRWSNTVEVTIENQEIKEIRVIKDVSVPAEEISNSVIDRVLEKQSLAVDTVSQATIHTKAYLKAIENALSKAVK